MRFPSDEPVLHHPRRVRARLLTLAALGLLSCSTAVFVWGGHRTNMLELEEAILILGSASSTDSRRQLAEIAIFRHAERSIEVLREAAARNDQTGAAARHYLTVLGVR